SCSSGSPKKASTGTASASPSEKRVVTDGRDWPCSIWLIRLGETPTMWASSETFSLRRRRNFATRSPIASAGDWVRSSLILSQCHWSQPGSLKVTLPFSLDSTPRTNVLSATLVRLTNANQLTLEGMKMAEYTGEDQHIRELGVQPVFKRVLGLAAVAFLAIAFQGPTAAAFTVAIAMVSVMGPSLIWTVPVILVFELVLSLIWSKLCSHYPLPTGVYQ